MARVAKGAALQSVGPKPGTTFSSAPGGPKKASPRQPSSPKSLVAGDRAVPLARVPPIARVVRDIIDEVDAAGDCAERGEHDQAVERGVEIGQLAREDEGGEDDAVFDPLVRPECAQMIQHRRRMARGTPKNILRTPMPVDIHPLHRTLVRMGD